MLDHKRVSLGRDRGMDDRLEPGERLAVAEHTRTQLFAQNSVGPDRSGEGRLDRRDQRAVRALEPAHGGIGIEHRHAGRRKHRRDGRFAHADRARQAQDERAAHTGRPVSRSATSMARNSASSWRGGATPKKRSKASAACPISIACPSMTR